MSEQEERTNPMEQAVSRRKLLASLGTAGAAAAMASVCGPAAGAANLGGATVADDVYSRLGIAGGQQGNGAWLQPLLSGKIVVAATVAELRASAALSEQTIYFVRDAGREGCFYCDPADSQSEDDSGITLVSSNGTRLKRLYSGPINARWYGAKGDGVSDDTAPIQQAIETAQRLGSSAYIPSGNYLIAAPITINSSARPIRIFGDGVYNTSFRPHPVCTEANPLEAVFRFTDTIVANRYEFAEFAILSGGINDPKRMKHGIYSTKIAHTLFRKLCIQGTQIAALAIGYGWCNDIETCELSFNGGDGLLFTAGQLNALNVINTKIFANGGIGIHMAHESLQARIEGCTIEDNAACGIYVKKGAFHLGIHNCYLETNGAAGLLFTNPNVRIKACIVLNGNVSAAEPAAIQSRYPSRNVTIADNFISIGQEEAFVACYAAEIGLEIRKNTFISSPPLKEVVLLRAGTNKTGLGALAHGIVLRDNDVAASYKQNMKLVPLEIDNMALANTSTYHTAEFRYATVHNYAPPLDQFVKIRDFGSPGSFGPAGFHFRQHDVYAYTGAKTPDQWGSAIDLALCPELAGNYVYFALYVKQSHPNMNAQLFITGIGANTQGYSANTEWRLISGVCKMPANGIVKFSVSMIADDPAKTLWIAHPVISEVGAPYEAY